MRRFFTFAQPIEEAHAVADTAAASDIQIADRRELERTMAAIAELPVNLRQVFVLRTIEGMSQTETAETLGIGDKAVETRLYRARKKLDEMLRG